VLPNDLAPDPNWVSPGGINGATQRDLLGDADHPAGEFGRDQRGAGGAGDRPLGPTYEDPASGLRGGKRPYLEGPMGGNSLDKPLHAEGPAHDWGIRAERYRTGSHSSWAAAAAFGLEPRRPPRPGGFSHLGGPGWSSYGTARPAGALPSARWGRNRAPIIIVVGLTLFAVVALLINLGTTARGRFSAVSVDATFIGQANVACATALGSGRLGSKTVMTSGTASRGGSRASLAPSGGIPAASAGGSRAGAAGATGAALSSESLARLSSLSAQLGRIHPTPAAAPQVKVWLADWQRYLTDERGLAKADAAHDSAAAGKDIQGAHTAAADADVFAADNGLSACAINGNRSGLEPIP